MTDLTLAQVPHRRSCYSQQKACIFAFELWPALSFLLLTLVHFVRFDIASDQQTVSVPAQPNPLRLQHPQRPQSTFRTDARSNSQLTIRMYTLKLRTHDLHCGVPWQSLAFCQTTIDDHRSKRRRRRRTLHPLASKCGSMWHTGIHLCQSRCQSPPDRYAPSAP